MDPKFLEDLEAARQATKKAAWQTYAALLRKTADAGGELGAAKDRAEMLRVVEKLGLMSDDIRAHLQTLARHAENVRTASEYPALAAEDAKLTAWLSDWAVRRAAAIAALDKEAAPIMARSREVDGRRLTVDWARSEIGRVETEHADLFGVDIPEPAPYVEKTKEQMVQEQHDLPLRMRSTVRASVLRDAGNDPKALESFGADGRQELRRAVAESWIVLSPAHLGMLQTSEAADKKELRTKAEREEEARAEEAARRGSEWVADVDRPRKPDFMLNTPAGAR